MVIIVFQSLLHQVQQPGWYQVRRMYISCGAFDRSINEQHNLRVSLFPIHSSNLTCRLSSTLGKNDGEIGSRVEMN